MKYGNLQDAHQRFQKKRGEPSCKEATFDLIAANQIIKNLEHIVRSQVVRRQFELGRDSLLQAIARNHCA